MRVNLVVPDDLVEKVDRAAKALNISRSAYICIAMSQKVQQDDMLYALPEMIDYFKSVQSDKTLGDSITEKK